MTVTVERQRLRDGWHELPRVLRLLIVIGVIAAGVWQWSAWKSRSDYRSGYTYCRDVRDGLDHDLSQQELGAGIADPSDQHADVFMARFIDGVTKVRQETAYGHASWVTHGSRATVGCDAALQAEISQYPRVTAAP